MGIIMQRTNTTIIFPDAGDPNIPPIKKGSVSISGAIHNVYLARQLLLGSLPIVMMFDLPESLQVEESVISKLQDEEDVTISVKPKARQTSKSCIVKTQERNTEGLYKTRHILLQLDRQDEAQVRAEIPETYKVPLAGSSSISAMAALPVSRAPYLNVNTHMANMASASPVSPSCLPMTPVYTPSLSRPPSTMIPPPPPSTPVSGLSGLPPNHPYLQDYAMLVLNNITRLQQQQDEIRTAGFEVDQSVTSNLHPPGMMVTADSLPKLPFPQGSKIDQLQSSLANSRAGPYNHGDLHHPVVSGTVHEQGWRLPQYNRRDSDQLNFNPQTQWLRSEDKWRYLGAPLAHSVAPSLCHNYGGTPGLMGGMIGWQDRDKYG